jgi:hypothetical protein
MTAKLFELLSHPVALDAMDSLSKGASPKGVLAGIAGDLVAKHLATAFGVDAPVKSERAPPKAPRVDDNVVDAEFKVINVTPKNGAAK